MLRAAVPVYIKREVNECDIVFVEVDNYSCFPVVMIAGYLRLTA